MTPMLSGAVDFVVENFDEGIDTVEYAAMPTVPFLFRRMCFTQI